MTGDKMLTYQELDDLCGRVAGGLTQMGVRPGDRVSLYTPNPRSLSYLPTAVQRPSSPLVTRRERWQR